MHVGWRVFAQLEGVVRRFAIADVGMR